MNDNPNHRGRPPRRRSHQQTDRHFFFDEARGVILDERGSIAVFDAYPEKPFVAGTIAEAQAHLRTFTDLDTFAIFPTNNRPDPMIACAS